MTLALDSELKISPAVQVSCRLSFELAQGGSLPVLPIWLVPCVLAQIQHTPSSHTGGQARGPHPPAGSTWLQLMTSGCQLSLFKWLSFQEHLLCGRACCDICLWSGSSGDRLGLQRDRSLNFCCLGKARLLIRSSESKQTFFLLLATAPKCSRAPGLSLSGSLSLPYLLTNTSCTLLFWL